MLALFVPVTVVVIGIDALVAVLTRVAERDVIVVKRVPAVTPPE